MSQSNRFARVNDVRASSAALLCFGLAFTSVSAAQASTYTAIYDFKAGVTDGAEADGPLTPGPNGMFYGVTIAGGAYTPAGGACLSSCGTVFKLAPVAKKKTYSKTVIWKFSGVNGLRPLGAVVLGADGSIYGAATGSWSNKTHAFAGGLVFQLIPPATGVGAWKEKILYATTGYLKGGVVADSQGSLYFATGPYDLPNGDFIHGSVVRLTPPAATGGAWAATTLHAFTADTDFEPNGDLTLDSSGALYGSSPFAGAAGEGQVFMIKQTPTITFSVLHEFSGTTPGTPDAGGGAPYDGVAIGPNGVLYGVTSLGGAVTNPTGYPDGVVFSLTPPGAGAGAWSYKVLHNFDYTSGGFLPQGGVTVDPSGALYGTTNASNKYSPGVIFKLTPPASGATDWTEADAYQLGATGYRQGYRMYQDGTGALFGSTEGEIFKFQP